MAVVQLVSQLAVTSSQWTLPTPFSVFLKMTFFFSSYVS